MLDITALPLRTDRTLRAVPYVTYTLLFTNLGIFLTTLALSDYQQYRLISQWGFTIAHPSLTTLFSYAFLHTDLVHLLGNLLILWLVGTVLESAIGSITFLLLYVAGIIAAVILYGMIGRVFLPESLNTPMIGASGAIAGVTGLAAIRYYYIRALTIPIIAVPWAPIPIPIPFWVPLWAYAVLFAGRELVFGIINVVTGSTDGVAHWAHIGGLGLGVVAALLLRVAQEGKRESVLEDSMRLTTETRPGHELRWELQRMLRESPQDPEVLEAAAAMALVHGERERSRDLYLQAVPLFLAAGRHERAATSYLNVIGSFPDAVLEARAQMAVASSLEAMALYPAAVAAFMALVKHYPESEGAQTALMRAAQVQQRFLFDPAAARATLRRYLACYPDSLWSDMVQERLQALETPEATTSTE